MNFKVFIFIVFYIFPFSLQGFERGNIAKKQFAKIIHNVASQFYTVQSQSSEKNLSKHNQLYQRLLELDAYDVNPQDLCEKIQPLCFVLQKLRKLAYSKDNFYKIVQRFSCDQRIIRRLMLEEVSNRHMGVNYVVELPETLERNIILYEALTQRLLELYCYQVRPEDLCESVQPLWYLLNRLRRSVNDDDQLFRSMLKSLAMHPGSLERLIYKERFYQERLQQIGSTQKLLLKQAKSVSEVLSVDRMNVKTPLLLITEGVNIISYDAICKGLFYEKELERRLLNYADIRQAGNNILCLPIGTIVSGLLEFPKNMFENVQQALELRDVYIRYIREWSEHLRKGKEIQVDNKKQPQVSVQKVCSLITVGKLTKKINTSTVITAAQPYNESSMWKKKYMIPLFGLLSCIWVWLQIDKSKVITEQILEHSDYIDIHLKTAMLLGIVALLFYDRSKSKKDNMMYKNIMLLSKKSQKVLDDQCLLKDIAALVDVEDEKINITSIKRSFVDCSTADEELSYDIHKQLSRFDKFVQMHQALGFNRMFVELMQQYGFSALDVEQSELLVNNQKAELLRILGQLKNHT